MSETIWSRLEATIAQRLKERPAGSYVVQLADAGHGAIASKIVEEAYELVSATAEGEQSDPNDVIHETTDLLFHVLVLLGTHGTPLKLVEQELCRRFGISGLTEKASRRPGDAAD